MNSNFLRLNVGDFTRGLVVAVIVVVLGSLQQAFSAHGLDVASFNWASILNTAITAAIGYLSKNLLTDDKGKVLGLGK